MVIWQKFETRQCLSETSHAFQVFASTDESWNPSGQNGSFISIPLPDATISNNLSVPHDVLHPSSEDTDEAFPADIAIDRPVTEAFTFSFHNTYPKAEVVNDHTLQGTIVTNG